MSHKTPFAIRAARLALPVLAAIGLILFCVWAIAAPAAAAPVFAPAGAPAGAPTPAPDAAAACAPATPCTDPLTATLKAGDVAISMVAPAAVPAAAGSAAAAASEGFWLAWLVMGVLVAAFLYAIVAAVMAAAGHEPPTLRGPITAAIPVLSVLGLGVALYLAIVETRNLTPVCGPVGDCGAVQASPFAKLFGVLPVGLLGAAGYIAIIVAWLLGRRGSGSLDRLAPLAVLGMALFGVLFSIYLTYLELYVIRAVCIWCVTSAFLMSFVLVLSVGPAVDAMWGEDEEEFVAEA